MVILGLNDQPYSTYWMYSGEPNNTEPHWYEFLFDGETGAEFIDTDGDNNPDRVDIHFVDGQKGDRDLIENGIIRDPGAPGIWNPGVTSLEAIDFQATPDRLVLGETAVNFTLENQGDEEIGANK